MDIILADEESLVGENDPVDVDEGEHETLLTAVRELDYPLQVVLNRNLRDLARVEAGSGPLATRVLNYHLGYDRSDQ